MIRILSKPHPPHPHYPEWMSYVEIEGHNEGDVDDIVDGLLKKGNAVRIEELRIVSVKEYRRGDCS